MKEYKNDCTLKHSRLSNILKLHLHVKRAFHVAIVPPLNTFHMFRLHNLPFISWHQLSTSFPHSVIMFLISS